MPKDKYSVIDLFSGAGGLSLGFSHKFGLPFTHVWANDFDKAATETYNNNFEKVCVYGDLITILQDKSYSVPKADVVIGGPPCQGFSLLNRHRDNDSRKELWRYFIDVVLLADAPVFLIENVPHIIGTPEHDAIVKRASDEGYIVRTYKLCAADYGVPQTRWRAFIVGCRLMDPDDFFPPEPTHEKLNGIQSLFGRLPWVTVKDAIEDLPEPIGTEIRTKEEAPNDLHFGRNPSSISMKRYRAIPNEGMNRIDLQRNAPELTPKCWINKKSGGTDLFGRLWWNKPAYTIRTEFYKPEKGRYLHPEQHRPITHREAARFQSFPDDFIFTGSKIEIARQIGNAVPPLLASKVAESIEKMLKRIYG